MSTFTNQTKNSATATNVSKNTFTPSNLAKSMAGNVTASAGQAMGLLLALTYAGGEILTAGALPTFTNLNKS